MERRWESKSERAFKRAHGPLSPLPPPLFPPLTPHPYSQAAIAAADAPAFEGVARFVLDRAPIPPPPPPSAAAAPATTTATRPPDALPAALAIAGGVNPVDAGATVRRLAADLARRGVRVALLGPADLDRGGGVGGALRAALRQLAGGGLEAGGGGGGAAAAAWGDDLPALLAWHADACGGGSGGGGGGGGGGRGGAATAADRKSVV